MYIHTIAWEATNSPPHENRAGSWSLWRIPFSILEGASVSVARAARQPEIKRFWMRSNTRTASQRLRVMQWSWHGHQTSYQAPIPLLLPLCSPWCSWDSESVHIEIYETTPARRLNYTRWPHRGMEYKLVYLTLPGMYTYTIVYLTLPILAIFLICISTYVVWPSQYTGFRNEIINSY